MRPSTSKTPRLHQFRRNAGPWGSLRLLIGTASVVGFGLVMPFVRNGYWPVTIGFAAGVVAPWFVRQFLVDRVDRVHRLHRYAGYAIVASCMFLREPLIEASPVVAAVAVAGLAAYLSVYVLLLSDPEVTVLSERADR